MYCPCCSTWQFSTECAVDLFAPTKGDNECRMCMGYNRALLTVHRSLPPSFNAAATTAQQLVTIHLRMRNRVARSTNSACNIRIIDLGF
jgi:hypothetical protein